MDYWIRIGQCGIEGDDYEKPWLFAVITGSCFSINLLPDIILLKHWEVFGQTQIEEDLPLLQTKSKKNEDVSELTPREVFILAFQIAVIYYSYNVLGMSALKFTSALNQTVMGSTTSMFTLIIGVILKTETFTIKKALCNW